MAGGELRGDNGAAFGPSAIAFASGFKVHHAIISIAGVDAEGGLMDQDLAEAEFARQVLQCGRRSPARYLGAEARRGRDPVGGRGGAGVRSERGPGTGPEGAPFGGAGSREVLKS